tara:strand:- start:1000 stop:1779 length:780 start_codon:yes stop_codon:yes gene_type:complete
MSDENENTQAEETQPQAEPKAEETQPIVEEQNVPRETSEEKDYTEPPILGKFNSQEELEKGYTELEKFVGGKKDELRDEIINELSEEAIGEAPEEYTLPPLPDGVTETMVVENPMFDWWNKHCSENAYTQEMYEDGVNKYVDNFLHNAPDYDAEVQKLGENANARLDAIDSFVSTAFSPDQSDLISGTLGQTAEGIEVIERIMAMQRQNIESSVQTEPVNKLSLEDVRSMMKDPRYFDPRERDESFVKRVDDAFARLYR